MARSGHLNSHNLHAMQSSGLTATAFSSESSSSTFFGQKCTQMPHPLHQFLFIRCSFSLGFFAMRWFLVFDKKGFKDSRIPEFKEFSISPLEPFYSLFTIDYSLSYTNLCISSSTTLSTFSGVMPRLMHAFSAFSNLWLFCMSDRREKIPSRLPI